MAHFSECKPYKCFYLMAVFVFWFGLVICLLPLAALEVEKLKRAVETLLAANHEKVKTLFLHTTIKRIPRSELCFHWERQWLPMGVRKLVLIASTGNFLTVNQDRVKIVFLHTTMKHIPWGEICFPREWQLQLKGVKKFFLVNSLPVPVASSL